MARVMTGAPGGVQGAGAPRSNVPCGSYGTFASRKLTDRTRPGEDARPYRTGRFGTAGNGRSATGRTGAGAPRGAPAAPIRRPGSVSGGPRPSPGLREMGEDDEVRGVAGLPVVGAAAGDQTQFGAVPRAVHLRVGEVRLRV